VLASAVQTSLGKADSAAQQLKPTATKTTAYTAAVGEEVVIDLSGGPVQVTLPTAPADGSIAGVRALNASTINSLTVLRGGTQDTIGSAGGTSATLPLAGELTVYRYDAAATRWLPIGNVKPLSALSAYFIPRSLVDAKGDLLVGTADDTVTRLSVGTTGQALVADPTAASGLKWGAAGAGTPYLSGPGVFNIKDYGAVGDGIANDLTPLQSAFTVAKTYVTADPTRKATVFCPPGVYRLNFTTFTAAMSWVSRVSLIGAGREQTIFNLYTVDGAGATTSGFYAAFVQFSAASSRTAPVTDCTFSRMTIDMSNVDPAKTGSYTPGGKAFAGQWAKACTWTDLTVINSPSTAIGVDYDLGGCIYTGNRLINPGRSPSNGSAPPATRWSPPSWPGTTSRTPATTGSSWRSRAQPAPPPTSRGVR
jgi:hypothetical protein